MSCLALIIILTQPRVTWKSEQTHWPEDMHAGNRMLAGVGGPATGDSPWEGLGCIRKITKDEPAYEPASGAPPWFPLQVLAWIPVMTSLNDPLLPGNRSNPFPSFVAWGLGVLASEKKLECNGPWRRQASCAHRHFWIPGWVWRGKPKLERIAIHCSPPTGTAGKRI